MCVYSCAEMLVLYMKCAELLSNALHTAKEAIKQGKLYPSASVKQGENTNMLSRNTVSALTHWPTLCFSLVS